MKAFITGITGQDGYYLAELLLQKGYEVHGLVRAGTPERRARLQPFADRLHLHEGDVSDADRLRALAQQIRPDEAYNLAAESFVGTAWENAQDVATTNGLGALAALQAFAQQEGARFFQASSAEIYGAAGGAVDEQAPLRARNPYGCAKVFAHQCVGAYREAHGLHASNGILFNHESPRRGHNFVTRKITQAVARIARGSEETLSLGNLAAKRDWGFAPDYVRAMWLILQQDHPGDYVIATGETHSVREFAEAAFQAAGIEIEWQGEGLDETGRNRATDELLVAVDPQFFRPAEGAPLHGDATKARRELGWAPSTGFDQLVQLMVKADLECSRTASG